MKIFEVAGPAGINMEFSYTDDIAANNDVMQARDTLENGTGPGSEMRGWLSLPDDITESLFNEIEEAAQAIRQAQALVVVGIGGSYLGARAVIDALRPPFARDDEFPIFFAGHHLDADYHVGLLDHLGDKRYAVNVISKSGTTTEPGLAFRVLLNDLTQRYEPGDLKQLVFATTDGNKGTLLSLSRKLGLTTFVVPDDVGGRFSVLSPVGLLPIAAAGFNVREIVAGAAAMAQGIRRKGSGISDNPALAYAAYRLSCYRADRKIEVLAGYSPRLSSIAAWWKQLFGESEGKDGKGIFPASVDLTSDLHSMGQWLQDGERTVFETIVDVVHSSEMTIPAPAHGDDGLTYLNGAQLHQVNRTVLQAAQEAHIAGNVPCLRLEIPKIDERTVGALLYLFEYACGVSAYALGVNPFDQPGVEAYKANMKRML
jgi:glucose-6-phosphate isomerase